MHECKCILFLNFYEYLRRWSNFEIHASVMMNYKAICYKFHMVHHFLLLVSVFIVYLSNVSIRFMRSFIIIDSKISRIILRFLTLYLRDVRLHGSHAVCTISVMQLSIIFSCKMIVATASSVSFITNIFQKESFHKISPLFYFQ